MPNIVLLGYFLIFITFDKESLPQYVLLLEHKSAAQPTTGN